MSGERGHALALAAVIGVLAMAIWALAYRSTLDLIQVDKAVEQRRDRDRTVTRALAAAIALLETAPPPHSPYQCLFVVDPQASATSCAVTYTKAGSEAEEWDVVVTVATAQEAAALPPAPNRFEPPSSISAADQALIAFINDPANSSKTIRDRLKNASPLSVVVLTGALASSMEAGHLRSVLKKNKPLPEEFLLLLALSSNLKSKDLKKVLKDSSPLPAAVLDLVINGETILSTEDRDAVLKENDAKDDDDDDD